MCSWGSYEMLSVPIPADLSHTGSKIFRTKPIDKCIAPIVKALNRSGIETRTSCCGHGKGDGRIDLEDGRVLFIKNDKGALL